MMGQARTRLITAATTLAGWFFPHTESSSALRGDVERLLIYKPCCLGDVIQVSPVFTAMKNAFPRARVELATSSWARLAAVTNPALDRIVDVGPVQRDGRSAASAIIRQAMMLRKERYQLALVLDRSPAASLITLLACIPERAGYDSLGRGFALNRRISVPPCVHELDLALSVVRALKLPVPATLPTYYVPQTDRDRAAELLSGLNLPKGARVVAIAPGGGANPGATQVEKRWSASGFRRLVALLHHAGMHPMLVGAATDITVARAVKGEGCCPVLDLTDRTSLPDLAALLTHCCLYVGNDSGTTHLAAAVGCPTVAIFGPTDPARYGPRGERVSILAAEPASDDPGAGTVIHPWFVSRSWQHQITADAICRAAVGLGVAL